MWPGLDVKYLVYYYRDFIVYIDSELELDWQHKDCIDIGDTLRGEESKRYNKIMNLIADIESIPYYNLDEKHILAFKRQLGEAYVRNFKHDFDEAEQMALIAKQYIIDYCSERSRYLLLRASGTTTAISTVLCLVLWLLRNWATPVLGSTAFYTIISMGAGALGGFFSIILRIGKIELDCHADKSLHTMEGMTKIIAGMIGALLVALCIRCEIILPVFSKIELTWLAMIIGGLIAGGSERFAPSIIKRFDNKT